MPARGIRNHPETPQTYAVGSPGGGCQRDSDYLELIESRRGSYWLEWARGYCNVQVLQGTCTFDRIIRAFPNRKGHLKLGFFAHKRIRCEVTVVFEFEIGIGSVISCEMKLNLTKSTELACDSGSLVSWIIRNAPGLEEKSDRPCRRPIFPVWGIEDERRLVN